MDALIALGSNLGNREGYLRQAVLEIKERIGSVKKLSDFIDNEPLPECPGEQGWYLNAVLLLEFKNLTPRQLLNELLSIENKLGRLRTPALRWGPRTIDLDLISIDSLIIDEPDLVIPHQEMHKRTFVLGPISEILPDWRHPLLGKTAAELLQALV